MSTRFAVTGVYRLAHQLRPAASRTLANAPCARRIPGSCIYRSTWTLPAPGLIGRFGPLSCATRPLSHRSEPTSGPASQGSRPAQSPPEPTQAADGGFKGGVYKRAIRVKLQRQKGALNRAVARFKSRLALFKTYAAERRLRKGAGSIARLRRYMSEKRLKFGAIARNPQRRKQMRELKEKVVQKSIALRIMTTFAIKKYGKLGAGIYFGVYVVTLCFMNLLAFQGYLTGDDVRRMLERLHITHVTVPDMESGFARFTVAYLATKAVEPIRLVVSILLTMGVNRALKR